MVGYPGPHLPVDADLSRLQYVPVGLFMHAPHRNSETRDFQQKNRSAVRTCVAY